MCHLKLPPCRQQASRQPASLCARAPVPDASCTQDPRSHGCCAEKGDPLLQAAVLLAPVVVELVPAGHRWQGGLLTVGLPPSE